MLVLSALVCVAAGPAFDRGQNLMAAGAIKAALLEDPDNCSLHAQLGILHARRGMFADALASLELCPGGATYEDKAIPAHANTLRAFGRGDEAADLRLSQLLGEPDEDVVLRILLEAAADEQAAGRYDAAYDLCWRALAMHPRGSAVHAQLAELHWALGDAEQAEYHAWVANLSGKPRLSAVLMEARFHLADGDLEAADAALERARRMQPKHLDAALLRAQVRVLQGDPDQAVAMLSREAWENNEHPALLLARAAALDAAGRSGEAATVRARHAELYG